MKYRAQGLFLILAVTYTVQFLVSCAPNGGRPSVAKKTRGPSPLTSSPPSSPILPPTSSPFRPSSDTGTSANDSSEGTSDSGGGTGVDGKIFESYVVDPVKIPSYKTHLKPLFDNIKSDDAVETNDSFFENIFSIKTWYVAPIELEKINKDVLGISFIKSTTTQIARQTTREVWIDRSRFDALTSREQADVLLHEWVMNVYFFKFMSLKDFCRVSAFVIDEKDDKNCAQHSTMLDKALPAEPMRALNDKDNENIRAVTGWILNNAQKPIKFKDLIQVLANNDFDKRMFNPDNYDMTTTSEELKVTRKELYYAINGAELTGHMPDRCTGITSNQTRPCKLEVEETRGNYKGTMIPMFKIRLTVEKENPIEFSLPISDDNTLTANQDSDLRALYIFAVVDWREKFNIGDRVQFGFFLFKKEDSEPQSPLTLQSVILKPSVIVSTNKTRDPVCLIRMPKVVNFTDDGIIIRRADATPTVNEQTLSAVTPIAGCLPDSVSN